MRAGRNRRRRKKLTAAGADKHALYEEAVQCPEADIRFIDRVYWNAYGSLPSVLREDFCGTAALCCEWVRKRLLNTATGVDLDRKVLDYSRRRHLPALGARAKRVTLVESDVLDMNGTAADVVVSMNFSYFTFKTRPVLLRYFRSVHGALRRKGLFVLDILGGPEVQVPQEEERKLKGFTYVWDQYAFNPVTHDFTCYIHFRFPDGTEMHRAFGYHWRLWSVAELREMLLEAGFRQVEVYWEGADEKGAGNGVFRRTRRGDNSASWIAFIAARP